MIKPPVNVNLQPYMYISFLFIFFANFLLLLRFRQDKAASPSPSVTSLQSDPSLDRPILFKNGAKSKRYCKFSAAKKFNQMLQHSKYSINYSIFDINISKVFFLSHFEKYMMVFEGYLLVCFEMYCTNTLVFPFFCERLKTKTVKSPAPSCTSQQSNQSLDRPILFKDGAQSKRCSIFKIFLMLQSHFFIFSF